MKQINIYSYSELSPEAQAKAREDLREELRDYDSQMALDWAIDDCALFEPKDKEMREILGDDYYEENRTKDGKYGQFVFKNHRKGIEIDLDRGVIKIAKALEITNREMFLTWLGVPKDLQQYVHYSFYDAGYRTLIQIEVDEEGQGEEGIDDWAIADMETTFDEHLDEIRKRIENGYESYFAGEEMAIRLDEGDYYFLENGQRLDRKLIKSII